MRNVATWLRLNGQVIIILVVLLSKNLKAEKCVDTLTIIIRILQYDITLLGKGAFTSKLQMKV